MTSMDLSTVSAIFSPSQKIYDAVHGFIRFTPLERQLIHSSPFQRLHLLHQLGIAYMVYPGATHSRFEHSLGTMELATKIFERIVSKSFILEERAYWLQIIRLAALCHDLGHLPFSHDAEKTLLESSAHEEWTLQVIYSGELAPIWEQLERHFPGKDVVADLVKMAIGEKTLAKIGSPLLFTPLEKVLSQVISGDFFGADRIDYLLRDAQCTGVSYGLFDHHQLVEMLCVFPQGEKGELTLGIEEDGIASCEALLLARHFMHQRVYQHLSVKAYKFHLSRFMKLFYEIQSPLDSLERYLSFSDAEILTALRVAAKDSLFPGHKDAEAIMVHEKRFRVIPVPEELVLETGEICKELSLPEGAVIWEPGDVKLSFPFLSFYLLSRSGIALPASLCSQVSMIPKKHGWVYTSKEHEPLVLSYLKKRKE